MNTNVVSASPTKDLFIDFLTKDLSLNRAIIDLVDNSLDGARRLRPDGNFVDLYVHLRFDGTSFEISDNCGGIPIDVARNNAFRFGRPKSSPSSPHSVGQFGVGMKRALFKLGRSFSVTSVAENSRFVLPVNVDEWKNTDDWTFTFSEEDESPQDKVNIGTRITVTRLLPGAFQTFSLEIPRTRLSREIGAAHQRSIAKGLEIKTNGVTLPSTTIFLHQSPLVRAGRKLLNLGDSAPQVRVELIAGVSDSKPTEAGWYIFCNGRLLLQADQTLITGWGEQEETRIPKYHNQFATFRGVAYLDCDDTSRLPWNTTKTGVDAESPLYKQVREHMITLMRPVIDFLNKWDDERTAKTEDAPLSRAVSLSPRVPALDITGDQVFRVDAPQKQKPRLQRIQYDRPLDQVEQAMKQLNVTSYKEVGERTFDYFYRSEVAD